MTSEPSRKPVHPKMTTVMSHWYVRVKFRYKHNWTFGHPPFLSKKTAEEYAQGLFGVEKWEVKEILMTEEQFQQSEYIRRYFEDYEAAKAAINPKCIQ
jgi:hypothetical protein